MAVRKCILHVVGEEKIPVPPLSVTFKYKDLHFLPQLIPAARCIFTLVKNFLAELKCFDHLIC
jgi:hypothetical protein